MLLSDDAKAWLSSLPHTWEGDIREPFLTVSMLGETYGIYLCSIRQNIEVALVLGFTVLMAVAISRLLYAYIISPRKENTTFDYLLGFGLIIPFWILSPMYFIEQFHITNKVFRFVMGTVPTLSLFRTLEAIYGYCPSHVTTSWRTFALYYSSPFLALYDNKTKQFVKANRSDLIHKAILYTQGVFVTGAIHSIYLHFPNTFIRFGEPYDASDWYSLNRIFPLETLWKNLCFAAFFQIYLSTCGFGLQLITILVTGIKLEEMWIDPLSKSSSFQDFWSRRWNLSVHTTLKRGIYLPIRQYYGYSKYLALIATFLASGLFHEWLCWITFAPLNTNDDDNNDCSNAKCFQPTYGPATMFFLFQALLIGLEFGLSTNTALKQYTASNWIPPQVATLLVVCIGASVAHWFSDGYVHSSFFLDSRVAYILIKRTS